MNTTGKILIVAVLLAAAGGAVWLKQPSDVPVETPTTNAPPPLAAEKQLPRLVDLGADKCIPCKLMAPILEELEKEYAGKFEVVFIDVWKDKAKSKEYGVNIIPTQIFYDASGKERFRHEGFFSKEDILGKWKELGVDITGSAPVASTDPAFSCLQPALQKDIKTLCEHCKC